MKQWLKSIFYTAKHSKPADENVLQMITPSIIGIALCMVCLAGTSWAWFTSTVQTPPQTIEAANFDISVAVTGEDSQPVDPGQPLQAGKEYEVSLTATGTAPSGGYCIVTNNMDTTSLYTVTLLPNEKLTFTLIPEQETVYTFTAVWGKYSDNPDITDGCIIGQEQPDAGAEASAQLADDTATAEYVVQSGDTLWKIALTHDMTVAELAAYNGIDDPTSLQIGQTIKIPTEDPSADPVDPAQTQETESVTTNNNTQ